jgi:hypothetical protein
MRVSGIILALACAATFLAPTAASAQATRTWISGVGDDVNPCSRTAPCKTFPGAIAKTAAGGEIDTLDPGGFGAVTVTKAITLADEGVGEGGILVAGTNGITVNCSTDPNCVVVVRGLQIDGGPLPSSNSLNGIRFIAGRALIVQNCAIRNFNGGSPNGYGISFQPSSGTAESLVIDNTSISANGIGSVGAGTGGGVLIQPQSGTATVNVSIDNSVITTNNAGVRADGTIGGTAINVAITRSEVTNNVNGGVAAVNVNAAGAVPVTVSIDHSQVSGNNVGINANGFTNATLRIGNSQLFENATGFKQVGASVMTSFGNNNISDNGAGTGTLGSMPAS